ncbi:unnamed protein product [Spirodela intermedia]|uniref:RING-type domain-containing protein n=2 Tax=Spirodela intermedia TaxID=51605 RepID=A0A7I8JE23_SPIIN|nr:unnamed protein product [Spirodela intermedia]CAA6667642.1 unnamed protein product [Spirodela intermedia]CAA7404456.1 unnamed protein product [Spirodela intermedia]
MASSSLRSLARRMQLESPLHTAGAGEVPSPPDSGSPAGSFDGNVVMILAVLLCAMICALGLHSFVRCALRCSDRVNFRSFVGGGASNAGVKKKALRSLPTSTYSTGLKLVGGECAICLSEFTAGERVRVLPNCGHGFHVKCIDRWLTAHASCPTCRQCLLTEHHHKHAADAGVGRHQPPLPAVAPLPHEGFLVNYRFGY